MNDTIKIFGATPIQNMVAGNSGVLDGIVIVNNESDVVTTGGNRLWFVLTEKKVILTYNGARIFDLRGGYYAP